MGYNSSRLGMAKEVSKVHQRLGQRRHIVQVKHSQKRRLQGQNPADRKVRMAAPSSVKNSRMIWSI